MGWCITSGLVAQPSSAYFGGQSFTVRVAQTAATGDPIPMFSSSGLVNASLGFSRLGYNHAHELRPITSADVDNVKSKAYSESLIWLAKL
jgi:hypothetical protein